MSVRKQERLEDLFRSCMQIANEEALDSGFVPVRKLAARLNAQVVFRPLLVEAMIAANTAPTDGEYDWKVLLDVNRFGADSEIFELEDDKSHMSYRSRNTIAHELLHTFAFKKEGGKFVPKLFEWKEQRGSKTVNFLEDEAEKLSSLLLIPEASLLKFLAPERELVGIRDLVFAYHKYGVSRQVFINRFKQLCMDDAEKVLTRRRCLRGVAIGMGEWTSESSYSLKTWPVFQNFENRYQPDFILEAKSLRSNSIDMSQDFGADFYLCGGNADEVVFTAHEGTARFPETNRCEFRLSVEKVARRPYQKFLFILHRLGDAPAEFNGDQVDFDELLKLIDS
jgi:hypothetical protein